MSLWSSLIATGAWPSDLLTLGVVDDASKVYPGREPAAHCNRDGEVWLERLPATNLGSGLQRIEVLPVNVHFRYPSNPGRKRTGDPLLAVVEAKLEVIRNAYDGTHRMVGVTGLSNVIHSEAGELEVDDDPDEKGVLDGVVRVTWHAKE